MIRRQGMPVKTVGATANPDTYPNALDAFITEYLDDTF
jgi:hypothetical protein